MIIPRVGDFWEFRPTSGKKHTTKKRIKRIYWSASNVTGRMCPWIEWSHTPKARHIGNIRVKYFLKERAVRRISSAAQPALGSIKSARKAKSSAQNYVADLKICITESEGKSYPCLPNESWKWIEIEQDEFAKLERSI